MQPPEDPYALFASRLAELLASGAAQGESALESVRQQLVAARLISAEQGEAIKAALARDWQQLAQSGRLLGEEAGNRLNPSRLGAEALGSLASALHAAASALDDTASKLDAAMLCHSGETAGVGTLSCTGCGNELVFAKAGMVPVCPKCSGTTFRKRF